MKTGKKLCILLAMMLVISLLGAGTVWITGRTTENHEQDQELHVVCSFYPIYIIGMNLLKDVPDVHLINLTPNTTGCLHDYQITTGDMKRLSGADVLLLNGGGMETFVEQIAEQMPELVMLYSNVGIEPLEEEEHDHEEDEHEGRDHEEHSHEGHDHGSNAHYWLDPARYEQQVQNLADGLAEILPESADRIRENAAAYTERILEVGTLYRENLTDLANGETIRAIIFHDAFEYLSEMVPLEVVGEIEIEGEESALSAGELAEVIDTIQEDQVRWLLIEKQFASQIAERVAAETDAEVVVLDSIVTGEDDPDAWIHGMEDNLLVLTNLTE